MIPPFILAAALIVGLLALAPIRRLALAGWPRAFLASYFACLWLLGLLFAVAPGLGRLLLPLIVVLYVVPFFNARAGIDRLLGRPPLEVRPPLKNVTPPSDEAGRAQ